MAYKIILGMNYKPLDTWYLVIALLYCDPSGMVPDNNSSLFGSIQNPRRCQKSIDFEQKLKNMTFQTRERSYLNVVEQYSF